MRIYDMFADDINRKINGVIQVEQSDDDVIEQELHEYVITNELKKHFMSFFSYYSDAFDTPTADTGVWISGFFGSGKSHFLKMLSYILENRKVKGIRTVERFREKFADDPATFMMIDKSTRSQTEAILFNIDVESSILMAKMPCMILQPLVENACQHGLEPTKRGGTISIQGWLENGNVFLEVVDNGVGMSEEQQKSIFKLEDIHSTKGGQVSGLGMNNVLSRLQYYFGSDCAWDIYSVQNKGTTLQISFPLIK